MNDEQFFLANAYLDGELTADERGIAEADPAIMAEVAELRAVQTSLRDVDPPTNEARESAIAAAMAEFGSAATPPAPAPVVPFARRPAYSRYLAIAAAAVGVGLFATVVVNSGRGGDDDSGAADVPVAEAPAEEPASEETAELSVSEPAFTEQVESADEMMSDGGDMDTAATGAVGEGDEPAEEAAEEMSAEMAADEPAADDATAPAARVAIAVGDPITNFVELGSYGAVLLDLQAANQLGSTPNTACDPEFNILGETTLIEGDTETPIYVGVHVDDQVVLAIDKESCLPISDAPLLP